VQPAQAKVIDLMEALKQSLSREGGRATPRSAQPVEERRRAAGGEAPRAARSGGKKK